MHQLLLVESESLLLWAMEKHLRKQGYAIFSSQTGEEALKVLQDKPLDLVVSNFPLPDMPGATILEEMHQRHSSVPVIAISSSPLTLREISNVETLVHIFLKKPFEMQVLGNLVKEVLSGQIDQEKAPGI
jgi:two-component system response regulator GlrR